MVRKRYTCIHALKLFVNTGDINGRKQLKNNFFTFFPFPEETLPEVKQYSSINMLLRAS